MTTTDPAPTSDDRPAGAPKPRSDKWVKRGFFIVIAVAVLVVLYFQYRGPMLGWPSDLDAALAQGRAEDRRVVVFVRDFPASETTKRMVQTTLRKAKNREALTKGHFILAEIRLDRDAAWAKKYGVTRTPTMLVIAPDGERFHRAEGFIGEVPFRSVFLTAPLVASRPASAGGT